MFGAFIKNPSGSVSSLFTPSRAQRVSDQACSWFCSSLPYSLAGLLQVYLSSSTRNAGIHWGIFLEEPICHKTWNKARGNFFIRFLLHKMCWISGGKVAFYDKSHCPASVQAAIFKPAVLCRAPNCSLFHLCSLLSPLLRLRTPYFSPVFRDKTQVDSLGTLR